MVKPWPKPLLEALGADVGAEAHGDDAVELVLERAELDEDRFALGVGDVVAEFREDAVADHRQPPNLLLRGKPCGAWRPAWARSPSQSASSATA